MRLKYIGLWPPWPQLWELTFYAPLLLLPRIIFVARGHRGVMDAIRTYRGVVEIMVESAALYSIVFVVLMILYPLDSYAYFYPLALCYPVTVRPVTSVYNAFS